MRRQFTSLAVVSAALMTVATGCQPQMPFYFHRRGDMDHYVGVAQQIEYPDLQTESLDEVNGAKAPLTLTNSKPDSYWDLTLQEAIQISLSNGTVIKTFGNVPVGPTKVFSLPDQLLPRPSLATTIHLPAITESDPRFGVEGALAAFDAQFSSSIFWEKNLVPQNTAGPFAEQFRPSLLKQDTANFQAQIAKTTATGGQFAVRHDVRYEMNNLPVYDPLTGGFKRWPNEYVADVQFEFRQPLMQGAGVGFNRIAGPGAFPGQANGVIIARLRTDQSLADFEAQVRNMVNDVERAYWYLYFQYRRLDAAIAGRDASLQTWRQVKAKFDVGKAGALDEAQSRQQYLQFYGLVQSTQGDLYRAENRLRYLMGLAHSDGRLIRPAEEPTRAKVEFDWYDAHAEALTRFPELRRQKWVIKQREMELIAAKNYLLPRLDAVGRYGWTGIGDELIDPSRSLEVINPADPDQGLRPHSAYGSLTTGRMPSWHLGVDFTFPFGFRREMAGVRNAQLNLIRERKILQEQELELSHQLAEAFRDLAQTYELSQTHYNRWIAANKEVEAVDAAYQAGTTTLDQVLDAQRRRAEAETEYYSSLVDYSVAIVQVHFRKGSLLEYNGVYLAEGPWPAKAYFDARRRARHRDASHLINYGFTQPRIVSQGPYEQHAGAGVPEDEIPVETPMPVGSAEAIEPEPAAPKPMPIQRPAAGIGRPNSHRTPLPAEPLPEITAPANRVVPAGKMSQNDPLAGRRYDLAGADLRPLAGKSVQPAAAVSEGPSPVQPAGYQQAGPAPGAGGKSAASPSTTHEPVATAPLAPPDPPASGWKSPGYRGAR